MAVGPESCPFNLTRTPLVIKLQRRGRKAGRIGTHAATARIQNGRLPPHHHQTPPPPPSSPSSHNVLHSYCRHRAHQFGPKLISSKVVPIFSRCSGLRVVLRVPTANFSCSCCTFANTKVGVLSTDAPEKGFSSRVTASTSADCRSYSLLRLLSVAAKATTYQDIFNSGPLLNSGNT